MTQNHKSLYRLGMPDFRTRLLWLTIEALTLPAPVLDPAAWPRLPHLHGHGGAVADLLQLLLEYTRLAPDSCRGQALVTICIFKEDVKESKGKQASQVSFKIKANLSLLCRGLPVQYLVKHQITCTVYLIFNFRRYLLGYILRLIHCP